MYSIWTKCILLIFLYIILANGLPVQDAKQNNDENCIKMSPDIQKQLNNIIEEITKHVNAISAEYDDVDLRLLEITIDRHFPEEKPKTTVIQITVNDCANNVNQSESDTNDTKVRNSKIISEISSKEDDFSDDLYIDDISPEKTKKTESQVANDIVIDEFDINFDDFNDRETNVINKNANKDIPVKLNFIDFNDIKHVKFDKQFKNINSTSKEIDLIGDDDKIFFRAMQRVRGDGPFVIYERCVEGSEQYWFL